MFGRITTDLWNTVEKAPGKLLAALRWKAKPFIVFGLWALNWPLSR